MPLDSRWRVFRDNAAGHWVAVCEPLKLTARGASLAELDRSVAELEDERAADEEREQVPDFAAEPRRDA